MRPSTSLCSKASRFQLSSKHGNKDYYKGRRQSHPDGIGYRTGPPGSFKTHRSVYTIDDTRARYFVGPAFKGDTSDFAFDSLKPFASVLTSPDAGYPWGLPGKASRRASWYEQMAAEVPEWQRLRDDVAAEVRPPRALSGLANRGTRAGEEESRP